MADVPYIDRSMMNPTPETRGSYTSEYNSVNETNRSKLTDYLKKVNKGITKHNELAHITSREDLRKAKENREARDNRDNNLMQLFSKFSALIEEAELAEHKAKLLKLLNDTIKDVFGFNVQVGRYWDQLIKEENLAKELYSTYHKNETVVAFEAIPYESRQRWFKLAKHIIDREDRIDAAGVTSSRLADGLLGNLHQRIPEPKEGDIGWGAVLEHKDALTQSFKLNLHE